MTTLTASDCNSLHMAGLGKYRPMGDEAATKCDALVSQGLLGYNKRTGIYYLTPEGADALSAYDL